MSDVSDNGYTGPEDPTVAPDHFNSLAFLFDQLLNAKWTITLGLVKTVTGGGSAAAPPMLGVQPMVNQLNGQGQPTPHGIINNVPALRLGGGGGSFVSDPVVGDIGLLLTASQDISAIKQTGAPANPGSFRSFAPSDSIYIGALLSAAPTCFVQTTSEGVTIAAGTAKIIVALNGTVTINGIVWDTHIHAVTTAPGVTGVPED